MSLVNVRTFMKFGEYCDFHEIRECCDFCTNGEFCKNCQFREIHECCNFCKNGDFHEFCDFSEHCDYRKNM